MTPSESVCIGIAIGSVLAAVFALILAWSAGDWPEVGRMISGRWRR